MKKIILIVAISALILSGCNTSNKKDEDEDAYSSYSETQITCTTSHEQGITNENNLHTEETSPSESTSHEAENFSHNSLPKEVIINILGHELSKNDITEINFNENGVWSWVEFEGFVYLAEPTENDFKKYNIGDEICGLKLTSACNIFGNDYLDNEYHDGYRCTSTAEFEGTLTMTGILTIAEEDGENLTTKKGDIIFFPQKNTFPIISGLPNNQYYSIRCGNISEDVISDLLKLPSGEEINAKITVSNIRLYSAMPVDAYVQCKIDNIDLQ